MIFKIKILIVCLGIILSFSFVQSPEGLKELKKISSKYHDIKSFESNIKVSITNNGKLVENFNGKMVVDDTKYFIKSFDSYNLSNGKIVLLVDLSEEQIYVEHIIQGKENYSPLSQITKVFADSIEKITKSGVLFQKISNETSKVYYHPKIGEYKKVELIYNASKYDLNKISLTYKNGYTDEKHGEIENPILNFEYQNQKINQKVNTEYFNVGAYIQKVNGKFQGKGKYKKYKVIENK